MSIKSAAERAAYTEYWCNIEAGNGSGNAVTIACETYHRIMSEAAKASEQPVSSNDRAAKLRHALTMYADPSEWSKRKIDDHWQLLFNNRDVHGHGWSIAEEALKKDGDYVD